MCFFIYLRFHLVPIPLAYVDPSQKYPPEWFKGNSTAIEIESSPMHECWAEMERLVNDGLSRNIGVCNFNTQALVDMLTYAKIKPAVLQSKNGKRAI